MLTPKDIQQVYQQADCLYTQSQVEQAIATMAVNICQTFAESNPLILTVMNGGLVFAGQLLTKLDFPLQLDYVHLTRYREQTVGESIEWLYCSAKIKQRTVLIIDDILDQGLTLEAVIKRCQQQQAKAVYSAVLVEKQLPQTKPVQADFVGLVVENRYVFGYGMDYKGYLRNANGIFAVKGL